MGIAPNKDKTKTAAPVYFGALDGFRGLLAVCVAIYHTYWPSYINRSAFFENGPVIIDLFFVFSGFLLFTLYADRMKTPDQVGLFLKKRFARLYPLHFFTLGLFVLFAFARIAMHQTGLATLEPGEILPFESGAREGFSTLVSNLALLHSMGIHDSLSFNVPSWTVSVEFYAYFTFAALLLWAPPRKAIHFGFLAVGVALIYLYLSRLKPNMDITYDYGFLRCMAGFYTGVIAAKLFAWIKQSGWDAKLKPALANLLEIATVIGSTAFVIFMPGKLQFFVAPVTLIFVLVFAFDKGLISRFMSRAFFRYLAKISYSVYMVHMIIAVVFYAIGAKLLGGFFGAEWLPTNLNGDFYLIPYLACVIGVSHLTQKYIEKKGGKWIMSWRWPWAKSKAAALSNP